jgi:O-antigen/teichoic acid export membrane protein
MLKYVRQLAGESLVYGVAGVLSRMLVIFLVPLYTRAFSPSEYGEMGLVATGLMAVSMFATLALDSAAHRWFWESDDDPGRKATIASWAWCHLGVALGFATVITLGAAWLAAALPGLAGAGTYIKLAAWSLPFNVLAAVATNWLRMQRRAWATIGLTLATTLTTLVLTVWLVAGLRHGVRGVFEAQLASAIVGCVVGTALLGDWVHPRWFRSQRLREMLHFAFPLIPASVAFWSVSMMDRWFVERFTDTAQVGLYQVGFTLSAVVALASTAFQQAWGPFSLSIHRETDARRLYALVLLLYLWVSCLFAAVVSVLAPEVLRLFTTPAYYGAATVVPWLSFSFVMLGLTQVAGIGPGIARQTAPLGIGVTLAALANVALGLLLTPRLGREGAAIATLVSQAIVPLYLFRASQRMYPIPYRFGLATAIVAASALVTVAGLAWRPDALWLAVAGKGVLLCLLLPLPLLLGIVRPAQLAPAALRRSAAPSPVPEAVRAE